MLDPLLGAVTPITPPEGLLRDVERRIDTLAGSTRRPVLRAPRIAAATVLATLILAAAVHLWPSDTRRLTDPSGRPVATLDRDRGVTTVRLTAPPRTTETPMSWYLWGIGATSAAPTPLGALTAEGLRVPNAGAFTHFAISLEPADFAGLHPTGPVIPLQREKK